MKRLILIVCMASFWLVMQAANTITVTGGSGHPGDELTVSVSMTGDDAVTAMELQLPLGEWLEYVEGSCVMNGDRSDGHSVTASTVRTGEGNAVNGTLRIYVYSLGLRALRGTDGEVLSFRLRLGDAPGNFTLTPTVIASDATGATVTTTPQSGTATILCPALRVVTEQIDFGHVPIRSSYTRQLTLQNYGNEPLTINNITASDSELSVSPNTFTIPANSSASTTITYAPLKRVPFEATLTIESDAVNAKIYNRWQTARVMADPFSVNELHVVGAQGASDTEVEIALRMNNMEPIVGAQVSFRLPDALQYVDGSATMTDRGDGHTILAPVGDNNTLTLLVYSPSNTPLKGDNGNICTFRVLLNGKSGYYTIAPQNVILSNAAMENMTSATSGANVRIQSPTISGNASLSFGQQDATQPLTAIYNIRNSGQAPLVIEKATFLADGYHVLTPLPLDIATNQSADIEVEYTAAQPGDFATTMNLYCNDPATRVKAVQVSGYAFSPNELAIGGQWSSGSLQVGISLVNHSLISAVQFDIFTDAAVGTPTIISSSRLTNHKASIFDMGGGTWKVLVYSMTNAEVGSGEGEILSILFPAMDMTHDVTFTLSDVVLSSKDGRNMLSPTSTQPQSCTVEPQLPGDVDVVTYCGQGHVHDMTGVRTNRPKGLVITNGKKAMVR